MECRSSRRLGLATALGIAIALAFSLISAPGVSAEGPTISVGSLTTGVGFEGTVSWDALDMAPPGLSAWTIDVSYDPTVVSAVDCTADQGGICNAAFAENLVRVAGTNIFGLEGDVHLADITFACVSVGVSELLILVGPFADATLGDPQYIDAALAQGSVTCTAEPPATPPAAPTDVPGDANCDGSVDGLDAAIVLQYDATLVDSLACQESADVNGDGSVDGLDAVLILQLDAGLL